MKRTITLLALFSIIIAGLLGPRPVAAQPSVLSLRIWGGSVGDTAAGVAADRLGNLYTVGTTNSYSPGGSTCSAVSIMKYSPSGNLLWQKAWFNGSLSLATGIAVDLAGNIYVTAIVAQTCSGSSSAVLLKLDPLGNLVWQKTINQGMDHSFNAVTVDPSGNVFVTGEYNGIGGLGDVLIMRFDTDGNLVWQKSWGATGPNKSDAGGGITVDSQDNVYVTGTTNSFGPNTGVGNLFLLKLNQLGQLIFQRIVENATGTGNSIAVDSTGEIYISGVNLYGSNGHLLLVKFDPSGTLVWQKSWGGTKSEFPIGLAIDPAGNLDIAANTNSYGAGGTCGTLTCYDLVLMKIDSSGNILSQIVYGNSSSSTEARGLTDSYGEIVAAGFVGASPPYQISPGNITLSTTSLAILTAGNSTLGLPTNPVLDARLGILYNINGNQAYTSNPNQFTITYGNQPKLTITTTPGAGGSVTLNGTSYTNGQTINITGGTTTAIAVPSPGYTFTGWNTTGGLFLSTDTTSTTANTTQVTIGGPGTLTARFQSVASQSATDYTPFYLTGIAAVAAVAIAEFIFFTKRQRRTH